jgi:glycosyltransferase involved in cell wall biosynthesis
MKKVLYIHQYFKTPEEGGAMRSYFIAKSMVDHGHKVQMLTAHNNPGFLIKSVEGIKVHYLPVKYSNNLPFTKRYFAFLRFVFSCIKYTNKLPKPDLIYATSTPLTIGLIALWWKWKRGIPYIFEVRDLWPEAPIQLGILKNNLLKSLSEKLETSVYKNAYSIIALSPGIQACIKKKSPYSKTIMIPNMADIQFFRRTSSPQRKQKSITIGYFGAFGYANNMDFLIKIAKSCKQKELAINYLLVGDGKKKSYLERAIEELNLQNVDLFPHKNRFEIRDLMANVDACITSFLNYPILETNSPNKFFDGLAAGKLCIINTKGWLKELVEENQCGIYVDPENSDIFPELIKPFLDNRELLNTYQNNALKLGNLEFGRDHLTEKICADIERDFP